MKKSIVCITALLFFTTGLYAADIANGKKLHDSTCTSCHAAGSGGDATAIYTRPDHRVTSLAGLRKQVVRCRDMIGIRWFDEEVDDVVAYLNQSFYKFKAQ